MSSLTFDFSPSKDFVGSLLKAHLPRFLRYMEKLGSLLKYSICYLETLAKRQLLIACNSNENAVSLRNSFNDQTSGDAQGTPQMSTKQQNLRTVSLFGKKSVFMERSIQVKANKEDKLCIAIYMKLIGMFCFWKALKHCMRGNTPDVFLITGFIHINFLTISAMIWICVFGSWHYFCIRDPFKMILGNFCPIRKTINNSKINNFLINIIRKCHVTRSGEH